MRNKLNALFLILTLALLFLSAPALAGSPPDYGRKASWLSLPDKPKKGVDVFWVYPTVYQGKDMVADLHDPQMKRAAEHTLQAQAAVFKPLADIFAPLYRQCNMDVLKLAPDQKEDSLAMGLQDIEAAFDYYLEHLNRNRPFILAGHSQGSDQLLKLLKKRLVDTGLRKRLVAAYVVGWSVTSNDLTQNPHLKMCRNPRQTGCVISYNCVAKGYEKAAPTILKGAIALNPLTWSTGPEPAPASKNLGAVFVDEDGSTKVIPRFTPARVAGGALIVDPADKSLLTHMPFGPGVYHNYDYSLFFDNLRQNAADRIENMKNPAAGNGASKGN